MTPLATLRVLKHYAWTNPPWPILPQIPANLFNSFPHIPPHQILIALLLHDKRVGLRAVAAGRTSHLGAVDFVPEAGVGERGVEECVIEIRGGAGAEGGEGRLDGVEGGVRVAVGEAAEGAALADGVVDGGVGVFLRAGECGLVVCSRLRVRGGGRKGGGDEGGGGERRREGWGCVGGGRTGREEDSLWVWVRVGALVVFRVRRVAGADPGLGDHGAGEAGDAACAVAAV